MICSAPGSEVVRDCLQREMVRKYAAQQLDLFAKPLSDALQKCGSTEARQMYSQAVHDMAANLLQVVRICKSRS
jgi:hypothetical protein